MIKYWESDLYTGFKNLGENASYADIESWIIDTCERFERLVDAEELAEHYENVAEKLSTENDNLAEDVYILEQVKEQLKAENQISQQQIKQLEKENENLNISKGFLEIENNRLEKEIERIEGEYCE